MGKLKSENGGVIHSKSCPLLTTEMTIRIIVITASENDTRKNRMEEKTKRNSDYGKQREENVILNTYPPNLCILSAIPFPLLCLINSY